MKAAEIFGGAGGLALGIAHAGFQHQALIEWNQDAAETLRRNFEVLGLPSHEVVHQVDACAFDYGLIRDNIDLLAGGPPCQPFSIGGKHKGQLDTRDMFPEAVRAIRELKPKAVLFENVRGLARSRFKEYVDYILESISAPEITRDITETWSEHRKRIRWEREFSQYTLRYRVSMHLINAADYGVPQKRERVFIVAWRNDLDVSWQLPQPTHSRDQLIWDQWITGEYWNRHALSAKDRPQRNSVDLRAAGSLRFEDIQNHRPWNTVRDAITGLRPLKPGEFDPDDSNHYLRRGARSYAGHTGSHLDAPAKTLKAGGHGVPGGENTLQLPGGVVRYFSIRESARLQTFPDEFYFSGSWSESMRQVGNAVPFGLSKILGTSIAAKLHQSNRDPNGPTNRFQEDTPSLSLATLT